MTNGIWRGLAALCIAAALALIGGPAAAQSFDCTVNTATGALSSFIAASVQTPAIVSLTGNCAGDLNLESNIELEGGTISGTVSVFGPNVVLLNLTLDGTISFNHSAVVVEGTGATATLNNVTVQNYLGSSFGVVSALNGGTLIMSGGTIASNSPTGGNHFPPVLIQTNSIGELTNVTINGNVDGAVKVIQGKALLTGVIIENDTGNSALIAIQSDVRMGGGLIAGAATDTTPTVALVRSSLVAFLAASITGTNQSNTIYATPGSVIKLVDAAVTNNDANDATILVSDGSTLLSIGGNTILNGPANGTPNGTAITVSNGSTFAQRNEAALGTAIAADTITGAGSVQMQSNMELGTGAATPSSWTGSITVAQNSSFRMDGGMAITGGVALSQGSNGFFNKAAGGTNTVSGHVTCAGSTSHVVGPNAVVVSGSTPAATLVTTGTGCYAF